MGLKTKIKFRVNKNITVCEVILGDNCNRLMRVKDGHPRLHNGRGITFLIGQTFCSSPSRSLRQRRVQERRFLLALSLVANAVYCWDNVASFAIKWEFGWRRSIQHQRKSWGEWLEMRCTSMSQGKKLVKNICKELSINYIPFDGDQIGKDKTRMITDSAGEESWCG